VPGGKTVALKYECQGDQVVSLRLSGDFFFHPEEGLEQLEEFMLRERLWASPDAEAAIVRFLEEQGLRPIGFGPADLAYLLRGLRC